MDHPQITHVSLCAGYGGIDLGLHRCIPNLRTIAYSEIEAFACELLLARMEGGQIDAAPIWPDLKSFPWGKLRDRVDILSGGYPCQPFSSAGKRLGREDPRHLWPYIADGISILRPRLCYFENVEGHISLGLREVFEHLGELGYSATWGIFSAAECGAPHQRKRVFVLAHRDSEGFPRHSGLEQLGLSSRRQAAEGCASEGGGSRSARALWPSRPGELQYGWEPPRVVADAVRNGWSKAERDAATMGSEERSQEVCKSESGRVAPPSDGGSSMWNAQSEHQRRPLRVRPRAAQHRGTSGGIDAGRGQAEPALGGDADGPASRMDYAQLCVAGDSRVDELRLLGNGVVPAVAERAFHILLTQLSDDICPTTT